MKEVLVMNTVTKTNFYTVKPISSKKDLFDEVMGDSDISKARTLEEIINEGKYVEFTKNS